MEPSASSQTIDMFESDADRGSKSLRLVSSFSLPQIRAEGLSAQIDLKGEVIAPGSLYGSSTKADTIREEKYKEEEMSDGDRSRRSFNVSEKSSRKITTAARSKASVDDNLDDKFSDESRNDQNTSIRNEAANDYLDKYGNSKSDGAKASGAGLANGSRLFSDGEGTAVPSAAESCVAATSSIHHDTVSRAGECGADSLKMRRSESPDDDRASKARERELQVKDHESRKRDREQRGNKGKDHRSRQERHSSEASRGRSCESREEVKGSKERSRRPREGHSSSRGRSSTGRRKRSGSRSDKYRRGMSKKRSESRETKDRLRKKSRSISETPETLGRKRLREVLGGDRTGGGGRPSDGRGLGRNRQDSRERSLSRGRSLSRDSTRDNSQPRSRRTRGFEKEGDSKGDSKRRKLKEKPVECKDNSRQEQVKPRDRTGRSSSMDEAKGAPNISRERTYGRSSKNRSPRAVSRRSERSPCDRLREQGNERRRNRSRERSEERDRIMDKSKGRSREKGGSREASREISKNKTSDKQIQRSKDRNRSRSRETSMDRSTNRSRNKSKDRSGKAIKCRKKLKDLSRERSRSRSRSGSKNNFARQDLLRRSVSREMSCQRPRMRSLSRTRQGSRGHSRSLTRQHQKRSRSRSADLQTQQGSILTDKTRQQRSRSGDRQHQKTSTSADRPRQLRSMDRQQRVMRKSGSRERRYGSGDAARSRSRSSGIRGRSVKGRSGSPPVEGIPKKLMGSRNSSASREPPWVSPRRVSLEPRSHRASERKERSRDRSRSRDLQRRLPRSRSRSQGRRDGSHTRRGEERGYRGNRGNESYDEHGWRGDGGFRRGGANRGDDRRYGQNFNRNSPQEFWDGPRDFRGGQQEFRGGARGFRDDHRSFRGGQRGFRDDMRGFRGGSRGSRDGPHRFRDESHGFIDNPQGFMNGPHISRDGPPMYGDDSPMFGDGPPRFMDGVGPSYEFRPSFQGLDNGDRRTGFSNSLGNGSQEPWRGQATFLMNREDEDRGQLGDRGIQGQPFDNARLGGQDMLVGNLEASLAEIRRGGGLLPAGVHNSLGEVGGQGGVGPDGRASSAIPVLLGKGSTTSVHSATTYDPVDPTADGSASPRSVTSSKHGDVDAEESKVEGSRLGGLKPEGSEVEKVEVKRGDGRPPGLAPMELPNFNEPPPNFFAASNLGGFSRPPPMNLSEARLRAPPRFGGPGALQPPRVDGPPEGLRFLAEGPRLFHAPHPHPTGERPSVLPGSLPGSLPGNLPGGLPMRLEWRMVGETELARLTGFNRPPAFMPPPPGFSHPPLDPRLLPPPPGMNLHPPLGLVAHRLIALPHFGPAGGAILHRVGGPGGLVHPPGGQGTFVRIEDPQLMMRAVLINRPHSGPLPPPGSLPPPGPQGTFAPPPSSMAMCHLQPMPPQVLYRTDQPPPGSNFNAAPHSMPHTSVHTAFPLPPSSHALIATHPPPTHPAPHAFTPPLHPAGLVERGVDNPPRSSLLPDPQPSLPGPPEVHTFPPGGPHGPPAEGSSAGTSDRGSSMGDESPIPIYREDGAREFEASIRHWPDSNAGHGPVTGPGPVMGQGPQSRLTVLSEAAAQKNLNLSDEGQSAVNHQVPETLRNEARKGGNETHQEDDSDRGRWVASSDDESRDSTSGYSDDASHTATTTVSQPPVDPRLRVGVLGTSVSVTSVVPSRRDSGVSALTLPPISAPSSSLSASGAAGFFVPPPPSASGGFALPLSLQQLFSSAGIADALNLPAAPPTAQVQPMTAQVLPLRPPAAVGFDPAGGVGAGLEGVEVEELKRVLDAVRGARPPDSGEAQGGDETPPSKGTHKGSKGTKKQSAREDGGATKARMERVVEEVKVALKPHYARGAISKDEYKDIMRRAVPKICHGEKGGDIVSAKVTEFVDQYVSKILGTRRPSKHRSANGLPLPLSQGDQGGRHHPSHHSSKH